MRGYTGSAGDMARSQVHIPVPSYRGSAAENGNVFADEVYRTMLPSFTTEGKPADSRRQAT